MVKAGHVSQTDSPVSSKTIAIVGCGLIGQAWATVFLRAGANVVLFDAADGTAEQAAHHVREALEELVEFGLVTRETLAKSEDRLQVSPTLEGAVAEADYIQENGPENTHVKAALTLDIDRLSAPGVPIGSSTSGIRASSYSESIPGRERCLVVHPINPPHLVPLVEIVPSEWTSQRVVDDVKDLLDSVGQVPIVLDQEIDGFVVNRLQGALLTEAFRLLDKGVASRDAIDKAVSHGLGLRWALMGPFETIHLNAPGGVADYVHRFGRMYKDMFREQLDDTDWGAVVDAGLEADLTAQRKLSEIAVAQKERDIALMRFLASRRRA